MKPPGDLDRFSKILDAVPVERLNLIHKRSDSESSFNISRADISSSNESFEKDLPKRTPFSPKKSDSDDDEKTFNWNSKL